ncbi:hypothetical protein [Paenibacillus sp. LHD-38]|uniref:hypothetical protein n=1 Tax=Paenibacillus sp. LHD-38 TaxID=3072143 RepID=UPI00280D8F6E|nr:hypothetical protein [Paenibacillus sp. LHD-38]MDQ8737322.1 hypothetical protein [Paenibacillus sp. LHD-38]
MNGMEINLYQDWIDTVKEIFRGSGVPFHEGISDSEVALAYFMQTAQSTEEAETLQEQNRERLDSLQQIILENFQTVILPDIRARTNYLGDDFVFKWVYNKGEHIVEQHSSYRIPL